MTTAIDTNVIVALWEQDKAIHSRAWSTLDSALEKGPLVIAAPVYSELLAAPGRDERFLQTFFSDTGIRIDWLLDQDVWTAAGKAFGAYAVRRRGHGDSGPRRILADFLIGAHALQIGAALLTTDTRIYQASFPRLRLFRV